MNTTETLAHFIRETRFEDLPSKTVTKAKMAFLDWLGVALGGALDPSSLLLFDTMAEFSGPDQASVVGHNSLTDIFSAAMLNGYFSHVLDYDDMHLGMIGHPSAPVLPALFALGQWRHLSGRDLLCSFTVGVEVECRIAEAVNPEHYDRGWHSTATLGHFGAVSGAGKLLKLESNALLNALGIAGTQAAGLRQVFGTMSKPFHPGKAAANGLFAAILADRGFTGSQDILEGPRGFCSVMSDKYDAHALTEGLGQTWQTDYIIFKRHASCYRTHAVIECGLALREKVRPYQKHITAINCQVPPLAWDMAGILSPKNPMEGKFSQPFCAAIALVEGQAAERVFTLEKIEDPLITELVEKTSVQVVPSLTTTEAVVEFILDDGRSFREQIDTETLVLSPDKIESDLIKKFESLVSGFERKQDVEALIETVLALDKMEDLNALVQLLPYGYG